MSNCIQIYNHTVTFTAEEINIHAYRNLMAEAARLGEPGPVDGTPFNVYIAWWFLEKNSTVTDEAVTIKFGQGRSTHTWRDFRQLYKRTLPDLLTQSKGHIFKLSSEDDGFCSVFDYPVVFYSKRKRTEKLKKIRQSIEQLKNGDEPWVSPGPRYLVKREDGALYTREILDRNAPWVQIKDLHDVVTAIYYGG